jgi:glucose uptake protein
MILPGSYALSLAILLLSMLCWGSWANTFKMSGKWRFELFYFDFAIGLAVAALIAAFTFGSMGWDGFSFLDDVRNAGKREDLYAFLAGCIFNLANMLLVGAIALAGMAMAFPIGIGLALVIGVIWSYALNPVGNAAFLGSGCVLVLGAVVVNALAYKSYADFRYQLAVDAAQSGARSRAPKKRPAGKGIVIAILSGILMGSFYPLVSMSGESEIGLGPYSIAVIFAIGVVASTFVYNLFFMNLPLRGEPVDFSAYFQGTLKQHGLGLAGGALWSIGAIANFVAARAEGSAQVGPAASYALGQGATLVSALWGLLVWKEFAGARSKVRMMISAMLLLFVLGLAAVSVAPIFGSR